MSERYARYQRLLFDWPAPRVLRIRMNNPGKLMYCSLAPRLSHP